MPVLVPLARALGVTVDDLLDGERPVRSLTRADWQSLLSFAFALGGGVLYFLLDLFMPALVCYLGYLGCMAYGVYLQKYYAYHSRWFLLGNLVMDLSVNLSLSLKVFTLAGISAVTLMHSWREVLWAGPQGVEAAFWPLLLLPGVTLVPALLLTGLTQYWVVRLGFRDGGRLPDWPGAHQGRPRLTLIRPRRLRLLPAAVPLLACAYWLLYQREGLPVECYARQTETFRLVLLALGVLAALPLLRRGDRRWIVPAWCVTALCWGMTGLRIYKTAWSPVTERLIPYRRGLADIYEPLGQWSWGMLLLAAALAVLWVLLQCVRVKWEVREQDQEPPEEG